MRLRTLLTLGVIATLWAPVVVHARKDFEVRYRFNQVWGATVRLVRVDYGFPVRDRDDDIGYLLFDYEDDGRAHPGSFELVRTRVEGEERVRVVLSIPAMPGYIERMMLDKLEKKLETDYGDPPPPPSERKPKPKKPSDEKKKERSSGDEESRSPS